MDGPCICSACHGPLDNNPAIDGAIVICGECSPIYAAAPDLLAALELAQDAMDSGREPNRFVISAAIRRARGES